MVFGTFDILHKGHLDFFKQARRLAKNPFVIVSVARDINVKKIKGQKPQNNEKIRVRNLREIARHVSFANDVPRRLSASEADEAIPSKVRQGRASQSLGSRFQPLLDRVVSGSKTDYIAHILKEKPDIIALGYDQKAYTQNLRALLKKQGHDPLIRRLKAHYPHKYKSSLFKRKML